MEFLSLILMAGFFLAILGALRMAQAAYVSPGDIIPYVNATGGSLTVGNIIELTSIFGVLVDAGMGSTGPNTTLANGAAGRVAIAGVFEVPKVAGTAFVAGDKLYWDSGSSNATKVVGANKPIGICAESAASAATVCKVKLNATADTIVQDDFGSAGVKADTILESTSAAGVTIDGVKLKDSEPYCDVINEKTDATGVTIDGVKLKDSEPYCDVINEKTDATGVTIDGVLLKDSEVTTDTIKEKTAATGVTIDGVLLKDSEVTTDTIKEKTATTGVTVDGCLIKDGRAAALAVAAMSLSAEITGNGSAQNTAHGLGAIPTICIAIPSDLSGGACAIAAGSHDATNAVFTVTNGEKYKVLAIK